MTYLHRFWTRPKQDASGGEKNIVRQDFEAFAVWAYVAHRWLLPMALRLLKKVVSPKIIDSLRGATADDAQRHLHAGEDLRRAVEERTLIGGSSGFLRFGRA